MANPEIAPRITYSPEGILELRRRFDGLDYGGTLFDIREILDGVPGYSVVETPTDSALRIEVRRILEPFEEIDEAIEDFNNPGARQLIRDAQRFLFFDHKEPRDGVISLSFWNNSGATATVYTQFQRWLNSGGLTEQVALECIKALAMPYGTTILKNAVNEFSYAQNGASCGTGLDGMGLGVISVPEKFQIMRVTESADEFKVENGAVTWNRIDLNTFGNCACWSVSGEQRMHSVHHNDSLLLYKMEPHNVDFENQSVSLVLGLGALAYAAASYEGVEDIFEGIEWQPSRW